MKITGRMPASKRHNSHCSNIALKTVGWEPCFQSKSHCLYRQDTSPCTEDVDEVISLRFLVQAAAHLCAQERAKWRYAVGPFMNAGWLPSGATGVHCPCVLG